MDSKLKIGAHKDGFTLVSGGGNEFWDYRQEWWRWNKEPDLSVALVDTNEKPVAVCRLFKRKARCRGIRLDCIGIGGVFVPNAIRGKGYGSRMLELLKIEMEKAKITNIAALYAQPHTLYERVGFVRVREAGTHGFLWIASLDSSIEVLPSSDWTLHPGDPF